MYSIDEIPGDVIRDHCYTTCTPFEAEDSRVLFQLEFWDFGGTDSSPRSLWKGALTVEEIQQLPVRIMLHWQI